MRKKWLLAALGASGCSSVGPFSNCPVVTTIAWDGGLPDGGTWDGGAVSQADCVSICTAADTGGWGCAPAQPGFLDCMSPCRGRAPAGLVGLSPMHDSLGSWLAVSAEMEAAAVHAFWQLADELEAHGIPETLRGSPPRTRSATRATPLGSRSATACSPPRRA